MGAGWACVAACLFYEMLAAGSGWSSYELACGGTPPELVVVVKVLWVGAQPGQYLHHLSASSLPEPFSRGLVTPGEA